MYYYSFLYLFNVFILLSLCSPCVFIYNSISNFWNLDYLNYNETNGQYFLNVDSTNYRSYSYTNVGYYNSRFSDLISSVPLITLLNLVADLILR